MLGHVMEWYYGYVGGIRQKPGSVGWKQVLIGPNPGPLRHCEATLATPAGRITSRWRIDQRKFHLEVEIPAGVTATAILPSGPRGRFTLAGRKSSSRARESLARTHNRGLTAPGLCADSALPA